MKRSLWPTRDSVKDYFPLPKEIFSLGLSAAEIAIYAYLLFCEDRQTFQCWPSYRKIGDAVGLSPNTICKHIRSLEERGLLVTEPTMVTTKDGRKRNGNLSRMVTCWLHHVPSIAAHFVPPISKPRMVLLSFCWLVNRIILCLRKNESVRPWGLQLTESGWSDSCLMFEYTAEVIVGRKTTCIRYF